MNSFLAQEYDNMQYMYREFYSTSLHDCKINSPYSFHFHFKSVTCSFHWCCYTCRIFYFYLFIYLYFSFAATVCYGPFMSLNRDIQELSVCCLYYFSFLDSDILQSLTYCCLCEYLIVYWFKLLENILNYNYVIFTFLLILDMILMFLDIVNVLSSLTLNNFLLVIPSRSRP